MSKFSILETNPVAPLRLFTRIPLSGCQLSEKFRLNQKKMKFLGTKPFIVNPLSHIHIPVFSTASFQIAIFKSLTPNHLLIARPAIKMNYSEYSGRIRALPNCRRRKNDYTLIHLKLCCNFHRINRLQEKHSFLGPPFFPFERTRTGTAASGRP